MKWLLVVLCTPLLGMDSSDQHTNTVSSGYEQFVDQMKAVHAHAEGIHLDDSDIEAPSLPTDESHDLRLPDMEYVHYLQHKTDCIHTFMEKYAKEGSTFKKSIDKAASSSDSSTSSSKRPRSLSKTQFNELLEIIGKAASELEDKHAKRKQQAKRLQKVSVAGTALGSCAGAFAGACLTAIVAAVITAAINL